MNSTPDIGLVLCGGGGRGAYQIGVWQALNELGLDRYINGVSGTSAGALNAALFACGNISLAENVWTSLAPPGHNRSGGNRRTNAVRRDEFPRL